MNELLKQSRWQYYKEIDPVPSVQEDQVQRCGLRERERASELKKKIVGMIDIYKER